MVAEDTAVPAVLVPVIDILNEIVGSSAPDDMIPALLPYEGKTMVTEDTAVSAVLMPVIDILNEIVGSSAPDDVISPLPPS